MSAPAPADTIFALSSGAPPAAIAIVRISGPRASDTLHALAGRLPPPRRASFARLRDGEGAVLDDALTLWFPGPATATGEDLAELHLHGGRAVVAAVLTALGRLPGLRPAVAGEFTRRAFLNGRIDLLEAEGLADLLAAETEAERRRALHAAEGGLSRLVEEWRGQLLDLSARIEAQIDHGDDEDDIAADPHLRADVAALAAALRATLALPPAERLRHGIRVVLAGPPNSGKSTLLNALAAREVAIVSPIAGTTRDLVEAPILLGGTAFVLIDSAGVRETQDPIEREGVIRAQAAIERADIVLWLGPQGEAPPHSHLLAVRTKADLESINDGRIAVSALKGQGLDHLVAALQHSAAILSPSTRDASFTLAQRRMIADCLSLLVEPSEDDILLAEQLRQARSAVDRLLGKSGVEDMLDRLFARFCVGK